MAVPRRGAVEPPRGGGGGSWGFALAGVLLAACAVAFALSFGEEGPDPNYVRARDSVEAYERGRELIDRDFDNPVYQDALKLLAMVRATSISAEAAAQLATDIRRRIDEFHARVQAEQDRIAGEARKRRERQKAFFAAQRRERLLPRVEFPECEHEEKGDGHKH